jgi:S1-C subfamily serine protease
VGNNFPVVIQTDMQLKPQQCGGPVLNLDGQAIGLTISRTDRTRSFIIPASRIAEILVNDPTDPALAAAPEPSGRQQVAQPPRAPQPRAVPLEPGSVDRLRRALEEMGSLLERMDREMEELED